MDPEENARKAHALAEQKEAEEEKDNKRAKLVAKFEIKRATSAER
jgi:hypothetical protein